MAGSEPAAQLAPDGRVILVSGANRGIGHAVAARLHAEGYKLSLGARHLGSLAELMADMDPRRIMAHAYEAGDAASARAWVADTVTRFGRLDGVVCCAGILHRTDLESEDESGLDAMWEINTKGPLRLVRAAFPHLKACGAGRVVNVVSLSGKRVKSDALTGYAMSKHAALAFTHGVRHQGWAHGIRATALCPGFVATDMAAQVTSLPREQMTPPGAVAALVATVLALPNEATVAELPVNCVLESNL